MLLLAHRFDCHVVDLAVSTEVVLAWAQFSLSRSAHLARLV